MLTNKKIAHIDIDGTLLNTEIYQLKGWNKAFKKLNIPVYVSDKQYEKYAGKQGHAIETELKRDFPVIPKDVRVLEIKESLLMEWFEKEKLELMPGAKDLLDFLKNKGFVLNAVTGGPTQEGASKLRNVGLIDYFKEVIGADQVEHGKPAPDIYELSIRRTGSSAEDGVAFEDTESGTKSASGAGLHCITVPNQYSVNQDLSSAYKIFPSLHDFLKWARN